MGKYLSEIVGCIAGVDPVIIRRNLLPAEGVRDSAALNNEETNVVFAWHIFCYIHNVIVWVIFLKVDSMTVNTQKLYLKVV